MENSWWLRKAEDMQREADVNNSAGFFKSLKEVHGPQAKVSSTLLAVDGTTTITEPDQITGRWKEYFSGLLNAESTTDDSVLWNIEPFQEQTHLSNPPTMEDLRMAINKTKNNKSPGVDGIPAEIYKHGGEELLHKLYNLIHKCWCLKSVPQEHKDVLIIPIFKNKGDHRDCVTALITVAFLCWPLRGKSWQR